MKIDFSAVIKDLDGEAVKDGDKDATLGRVACSALLASYAAEQNLAAEDKVRRFRLAETAAKGGEQEIKVEDVALIKQLIGKMFAPLIGRAPTILLSRRRRREEASMASKGKSGAYLEESVDSMGKDPLKRDRRYDDAGNPVSRDALIERVSNQNDGGPEKLPKV